ncbi:GNAT family protein [Mesorhizobium sp. B2-3-15]|uniref:GNAT family N-acetyltransferase n=1 Tax=Mesorhizobium sp. B2-3-15 TaxID=2589949 RepID=UPI00112C2AAF|nr:GNAT family protein [Mesorhizobium sp. B2-3-15]TPL71619.1 GNAT family N-acetyltransferase [Mesorhizobium sp. B2-3-15]
MTSSLGTRISQESWPFPIKDRRAGNYVDLLPLSANDADALWPAVVAAPESFTYLRYGPFAEIKSLQIFLKEVSARTHQPFWIVEPKGQAPQGWLSICDVDQKDSSIEIGSIWFSPSLQGTRAAREAIFLLMCHAMDELCYQRLVWRCQSQNQKSFKAAKNLGFTYEGTWRRAAIVDGWQRDVAWFSILKEEWPCRRATISRWLMSENFDAAGNQMARLAELDCGM